MHYISMMLDDTRGGLDASSLHRDTSMDISLYKKFYLLSCHRDTLKAEKIINISQLYFLLLIPKIYCYIVFIFSKPL